MIKVLLKNQTNFQFPSADNVEAVNELVKNIFKRKGNLLDF